MQKLAIVLLGFSLFVTLAACGTKGQLYIPEERYPQQTQEPENSQKPPETTQQKP